MVADADGAFRVEHSTAVSGHWRQKFGARESMNGEQIWMPPSNAEAQRESVEARRGKDDSSVPPPVSLRTSASKKKGVEPCAPPHAAKGFRRISGKCTRVLQLEKCSAARTAISPVRQTFGMAVPLMRLPWPVPRAARACVEAVLRLQFSAR